MSTTLSDTERLSLIREVFEKLFDATSSFEGDLGCDLSYLLGAIAGAQDAECVEWEEECHEVILNLCRETFPADHPVWHFIQIDNSELTRQLRKGE